MNIKDKVEEIVKKVTSDDELQEQFIESPIATIEKVAGVNLPDDVVEKIEDAIKTKLKMDKVSGALGSLKKLF